MSTSSHFRVAVVDRHQLFVDCLGIALEIRRFALQPVTLPAECARTQQVLASVLRTRPGVAVVDTDLGPQCDSIELIAALAGSGVAVVAVASDADEARWGHCLASGARIVVPKSACLAALVSAIRRLSQGERVLELSERERLLRVYRQHVAQRRECLDRLGLLSTNEAEILLHLAEGHTVREIAALRVVSEATVRTQVKSVLSKLEVRSQLAAVAIARTAGWDTVASTAARSA